ncbi:MAG: hypothetical protein R3B70_29825 [Polyangiaceae bacterium]
MSLSRCNDDLTVTFVLMPLEADEAVKLRCTGVSDLRFRGPNTDLNGIVLLMAQDISARGWEGIRLQVVDYDEEFVSFYCREVEKISPDDTL